MGCGCSGSTPTKNQRRSATQRQASPSQVPGGPGTPGYTWDGPQRTPPRRAESGSSTAKK